MTTPRMTEGERRAQERSDIIKYTRAVTLRLEDAHGFMFLELTGQRWADCVRRLSELREESATVAGAAQILFDEFG